MEATPVPTLRTVLVALTIDDGTLSITPAGTVTPRVLTEANAYKRLIEIASDPTIKPCKTAPDGFDVGDMFKGIGRALAELGSDPKPSGSNTP